MQKSRAIKNALNLCVIGILIITMTLPAANPHTFPTEKLSQKINTSQYGGNGNTFYVGGSGPNNYTKIQDALNDASDGDIVSVYDGIYYENIIINKSITLYGENRNMSIIDGSGNDDVISVTADYVNISDFTIQHSGNREFDAGIDIFSNHNKIRDNIIKNSEDCIGIIIRTSNNNTIINNYMINYHIGIHIYKSHHNSIQKNSITSGNSIVPNSAGLVIAASRYNLVSYNVFKKNDLGIYIVNLLSDNLLRCYFFNTITKNNFIENNEHASFLNSFLNAWSQNYWDDWDGTGPKSICGYVGDFRLYPLIFNWANFDWHPANKPYEQ